MKIECKKVAFANEGAAIFYIKKLKASSTRAKIPKRAYLCEKCLTWHLTSRDEIEEIEVAKLKQKIKQLGKIISENNLIINKLKAKIKIQ